MTQIMMISPYQSSLESHLENDPRIDGLTIVRSLQEFQHISRKVTQAFDFVITSLVISELLPTRMRGDLHLLLDGFRFVREQIEAKPETKVVVCSTFQHVRLVMRSYELGAKWYIHDHRMKHEVVDGILSVDQGETLEPYGLSVSTLNRWLAAHDPVLRRFTFRDIDFVEALLVDIEYSDEMIERLGLSSRESVYFRIYKVLKLGDFADRDELVAHARSAGLRPLDRLQPGDDVLVEGVPTPMSASRKHRFNPTFMQ